MSEETVTVTMQVELPRDYAGASVWVEGEFQVAPPLERATTDWSMEDEP